MAPGSPMSWYPAQELLPEIPRLYMDRSCRDEGLTMAALLDFNTGCQCAILPVEGMLAVYDIDHLNAVRA